MCVGMEKENCEINSKWDCEAKNYCDLSLVTLSPIFEESVIAYSSLVYEENYLCITFLNASCLVFLKK